MISNGGLHQDFLDLSTGLAGEIFHKLSTNRIKTAIVVDLESIPSKPFQDWAGECNRGREIRFCESLKEAENWLLDNPCYSFDPLVAHVRSPIMIADVDIFYLA